ncbi:MAG TPA: xanthine dehydrogenase family protein molybdopterin-binding subunit [Candidatus Binatia bacterium]|nr:xanthine dehydrogenase family protein molybdopterin-binding subunit [Candidatus Binatia bacterium]
MVTEVIPRHGIALLGEDEVRVEGRAKVSGEAKFAADFELPGLLWAAFLRSSVPHARIAKIETRAARAISGVHAVLTGNDVGEHYYGRALFDRPVIATDRVRFIGDTVAAVAAESREIAEAAVLAIEVEYDGLPAVFEPREALKPDAPVLHERFNDYPYLGKQRPVPPHPNIHGHVIDAKGDVEEGFRNAARIFEHSFTTPRYHGGFIEPRATLVWIDDAGKIHVVSTNKSPFLLRQQLSVCAGIPVESIVVEQAYIGGDFGAKGFSVDEFPCYYLARATKRPVKYVKTYLDDMQTTNVRHPAEIAIKSGVDREGRFTAMDIRVLYNGGAYAAGKPVPTLLPGGAAKSPYSIPHMRQERAAVYTNTIPSGHVRAPGDIQIHFAVESHVDMIAHELGIDPIEFRLRNAIGEGEPDVDGTPYREPRAVAVLEELRRQMAAPLPAGHSRGIALAVRHIGGGNTNVTLRLEPSGAVRARSGVADQGGGQLTVLQRVVAASLGIPLARVHAEAGSTDAAGFDQGAGGSRETHVIGRAAIAATQQLRTALEASGWNGTPETWEAAVNALLADQPGYEVKGTYASAHHEHEPDWSNFAGYMVELSLDRETGAFTMHEIVLVADVGTIINPVAHQGQLSGGVVFGIGSGATEELVVEDGKILNLNLGDYKLPTQADVPPLRTILLPPAGGPGPFGAKMAGEVSTSGVAPAIANAVAAACGARVTELPVTAERVFAELDRTNVR